MAEQTASAADSPGIVGPRFVLRVFYVFASLALFSLAISLVGKWLGGTIASVGNTESTEIEEVVIGNNVLNVPANYIRFENQRTSGEARRLDLYMRWPDLAGYSNAIRDDFNHRDGSRRILFMSIEPQLMSRDMSARLEPIYRRLIELPGTRAASGLRAYRFSETSGYMNEMLMVGDRPGQSPFVARCLTGAAAADSLAACERDVHFGDELSLAYRFPSDLLGNWRELDQAVIRKTKGFLQTAR